MSRFMDDEREWLEADGLGGFAMGTVNGARTRRYHALLLAATTPPTGRMVLVNGFDAWIETASGRYAISSQRYAGGNADAEAHGIAHPDGASRIESFTADPWPAWKFRLEDGTLVRQEIVIPHERAAATVTWRLLEATREGARVIVRPFLSGRDYHSTHHENGSIRAGAPQVDDAVTWEPYAGVPAIVSRANARYEHQPDWYRRFLYTAERERGLDDSEDLWSPGWLIWELTSTADEAVWHLEAAVETALEANHGATAAARDASAVVDVRRLVAGVRETERARRAALTAASPLHRAADAYLVRRGAGRTIVAGYPWFTDWGRDTFIALRGLCLSTGRLDDAREILVEWSSVVSEGMLPNRFPDGGDRPEFNAVDASLWFIAAVQDYCDRIDGATDADDNDAARERMMTAVQQILEGYARGTRYGIRLDADGLLACGEPGVQLTWMDARIGDRVITPRTGKPVEIQALWLNALLTGAARDSRWRDIYERGRAAFAARFWNEADGCLYDVVDVDHQPGRADASCRPNQIFAVGGLAHALIDGERARRIVDTVERRLLTPLGLRSLAPGSPGYAATFGGGPEQRDSAYHQGTVWPWLMGAFVEAWLRVRAGAAPKTTELAGQKGADAPSEKIEALSLGESVWARGPLLVSDDVLSEARERFLAPLMAHLEHAGIGHVSEVASAEPPFTPGGCPFQAWSLGELLRIAAMLTPAQRGVMRAISSRKAGSSRSQRSSGSTGTKGIQPDRAS